MADTGDGPADDPGADADDDAAPDDGASDETSGANTSSADASESGGDGESGDTEASGTETGEACPPGEAGCACTLDGTCSEGLSCVDGVCEACDGCDTGQSGEDTGREVDPCASGRYGDGPYCGETIGGTEETLYLCAGGETTATSLCDFGCAQCDPFVADVCKSFAGQSDAAACD